MTPDTAAVLLDALLCAAAAHGVHESEIGRADPDWPQWYAQHMAATLGQRGYRLIGGSNNDSDIPRK